MGTHSFRRVLGDSTEISAFTKFLHQEIRWNFRILRSETIGPTKNYLNLIFLIFMSFHWRIFYFNDFVSTYLVRFFIFIRE